MRTLEEIQRSEELQLFSIATSNKLNQLTNKVNSGNEHSLNYGRKAVLELIPIIENRILRELDNGYLFRKPFMNDFIKPQYDLYNHEQYYLNKSERTIMHDPVLKLAEAMALIMVSNISKEVMLSSIANNVSHAAMVIFNVPHNVREEYKPSLIKLVMGWALEVESNSEIFVIEQRNRKENIVAATEAWVDYISESLNTVNVNTDSYGPMVCKPIKHSTLYTGDGGYLTMDSPLIKNPFRNRGKIDESIVNFNNTDFFVLVNKIQETPYCVNTKLFEVISDYYSNGYLFKDYPTDVDSVKSDVIKAAMEEISNRNSRRKDYAEAHGEVYEPLLKSTETSVINEYVHKAEAEARKTVALFEQCEYYSGFSELYFPIFFDFRGRRYTYASYGLTYMGTELSKALIQFAQKEKFTLTGIKNLFSNLGNALGLDKIDYLTKRVKAAQWFRTHIGMFFNSDYRIFFDKQDEFDEPINAMAICIELCEWLKDSEYESGYMAHRDARCSGTSLLGSMMGDEAAMILTSVLEDTRSERLPDAYMAVANVALKSAEDNQDTGLIENKDILFSRSAFKKPVMTKSSYGLTDYSVREGNKKLFIDNDLDKSLLPEYNKVMLESLSKALPSCSEYLVGIRKCAKSALMDNDGLIKYKAPFSGFPVVYKTYREEEYRMEAPVGFRRLTLVLKRKTGKVDSMRTRNGIAPNVLHSIDTSVLYSVGLEISDFPIATIHDSIASHPNHSDTVRTAYNKALLDLNRGDVLNNIATQLGHEPLFSTNHIEASRIIKSKHSLV